jgi:dedicator of cytokinesis protein 3
MRFESWPPGCFSLSCWENGTCTEAFVNSKRKVSRHTSRATLSHLLRLVVDTLDKVFSLKKGDELSRGVFLNHLRALFDAATLDDALRDSSSDFLDSIATFLDLLLSVKDLPESDEFMVR